ncbi:MAG: AHH domain-containing protein [Planctomycetes bacterium]|nr:AHH domain-containing protein [Planctomycetota bacterium]
MIREGRGPTQGQAAGHLVPSTGTKRQYAAAVRMRALLARYRIDINDAANGVPIDHPRPHNETHKAKFLNDLENRLNNVEANMKAQGRGFKATRRALRNELRQVGKETPKKCN